MATALRSRQMIQLQSFWNLIQTTDEDVQRELYVLLEHKYQPKKPAQDGDMSHSFLQMKGILKGDGTAEDDRRVMDDYLAAKYGV
ncbi:MAG: hypothetical protein IJV33_11210 [Bacteroidaceae bacterium]|nr:hypothetical protein [Bacteroidaceae bacterium]